MFVLIRWTYKMISITLTIGHTLLIWQDLMAADQKYVPVTLLLPLGELGRDQCVAKVWWIRMQLQLPYKASQSPYPAADVVRAMVVEAQQINTRRMMWNGGSA